MRVELTGEIVEMMKAELMRGQSLEGACRYVGITSNACQLWRGAGKAILDGRAHRGIPSEPKKYAYKSEEKFNQAMEKYFERCNLLTRFFLETERGRGHISGYMMDVLFRLIERGDVEKNDKVWLPIFTYMSRAYKGEWSEAVKIDKSVEVKHDINVNATLNEVQKLFTETAQREAVKRLSDDSISESDAEELKQQLSRLGGGDVSENVSANDGSV